MYSWKKKHTHTHLGFQIFCTKMCRSIELTSFVVVLHDQSEIFERYKLYFHFTQWPERQMPCLDEF